MGPQRMYGLTPWVRRLLVANLLVFLVQSTLLTSPSFAGAFGFSPARAWQYPWTFVNYMFLIAGFQQILFKLLLLRVLGCPAACGLTDGCPSHACACRSRPAPSGAAAPPPRRSGRSLEGGASPTRGRTPRSIACSTRSSRAA